MKNLLLSIFALFFLYACQKPVELDLPEFTNQPVVNCFFTPEEPFVVYVSKTASQFDSVFVNVDDAFVQIFKEDLLFAELPSKGNGVYSDSTVYPEKGVYYTIRVNIPDYPEVFASDSVPSSFSEFTYKSFKEKAWYSDDGNAYNSLTFEIDDQPGNNYFEVLFKAKHSRYESYYDSIIHSQWISNFTCFDPVIEEGRWQAIFTDRLFDGTQYTIQLMNSSQNALWHADSLDIVVQVVQGTIAFYSYRSNYLKHHSAQYSDFFNPMEPVIMYSNIENGYGIFAGYQSKFYPVNIKD